MFTWRMEVKDETFTNLRDHPSVGQDYITPDDGVATLDDFSVDGAGNCLEARFRASPKFVDIRARDIVSLEVSEDGGSTWVPVYRGYVVTAGNPRSLDVQEYKLNGLRQRLFEVTNPEYYQASKDVAEQINEVLAKVDDDDAFPAGIESYETAPTQNTVLGERYTRKESIGETLQAYAESVGSFIVPPGASYSYDGVTYSEGDRVPATRFGVDASGVLFFRRAQTDPLSLAETTENVLAEYTEITGEEIVDTVVLEYANQYQPLDNPFIYLDRTTTPSIVFTCPPESMEPLTQTFVFGTKNARRKVVLDTPFALMDSDVEVLINTESIPNPENAYSGGSTSIQLGAFQYLTYGHTIGKEVSGGIVVFDAEPRSGATEFKIDLDIGAVDTSSLFDYAIVSYSTTLTVDDSRKTFIFPFASPAPEFNVDSGLFRREKWFPYIRFSNTDMVLSNLSIYIPDTEVGGTLSEQFASGFVRDVQPEVAEVRLINQLGAVAPRMNWTPEGEYEVTVPVERIQYTLTPNDGLITTYELGQAFDAELLSERAVLKGLAREAVSE